MASNHDDDKMTIALNDKLRAIQESIPLFIPELILSIGIIVLLIAGLLIRSHRVIYTLALLAVCISFFQIISNWSQEFEGRDLFGMLHAGSFSMFLKILFDVGAALALVMSFQKDIITKHRSEYTALILTVTLGAHLIVMSTNLVMVFLSLELMSISSYILTGFVFKKESSEGSLKYFLFGSVASAVMLYGFTILYGMSGTLDFTSGAFAEKLISSGSPLLFVAVMLSFSGFLFKISAVPMHPWAPDVYEISPMPVVAFFSVVPKLAGLGILTIVIRTLATTSQYDWQIVLGIVAFLSITVGNFSALRQKSAKRMMAYSSIAQSGFLLLGIIAYSDQGLHFMLFYAVVYLLGNYAVFIGLQFFERNNIYSIDDFKGSGRAFLWPQLFLLIGLISLTGLPPTAGFTAKLFIFSSLWESYQVTGKPFLLGLVLFGLLNTIVALFYYLRIPFFAFIKSGVRNEIHVSDPVKKLFGLILVLLILVLFFTPNLLMSLINRITFVL